MRLATVADIAALHRVRMAVRENTLSDPNRISTADYTAALDRLGCTWLIEMDNTVVAFATGYRDGSIWALFVHPDHEGRGYGKALHTTMLDWLWSLGHARLWLCTDAGTRAERFYLSLGWQPAGLLASGEVRLELLRS